MRDGSGASSSGMTVEWRRKELRLKGSSSISWFLFRRRMNHTINAVMTPMPMMAAAAIPAMDPTLIPLESPLVGVAVAALVVLLAVTWTVERVTELTGAVVLVKVLAGGVVGMVLDEVVPEAVVEVETDDDANEVLDVETTLEVWEVVVVR